MNDVVSRRATLQFLAKAFSYLLALPLAQAILVKPTNAGTHATPIRPKGENMMQDPSGTTDLYRLPRHVVPSRYELRLEPLLDQARFLGQETVTVTVHQPTTTVVMNAVDLTISEATIEQVNGPSQTASIELDEPLQRCRLTFPYPVAPGEWRLHMTFQGTLNDKLRGFYRSTYKDHGGATRTLAATQFEATDARRAFPCWDEPDFKAVFATTLAIERDLTAVSNSRILSESIETGKKVLRFADTIMMSTYLVAFVVGRIEATAPVLVGRTELRIWSVPGKGQLTGIGLEIAAASLRFFEEYYGIPYPGDKLDLLAIPDFASGAMENFGAITFRETALLVDGHTGTHAEIERVADVVAHENAHMWFGDLVTMSWWNGLWLNEAFATFMEMLAVDAWKPEWKRWDTFGASRAAALSVDGLQSTRPIEYPVRAPKDADAMFDVLTYEKGASVLRMLEQHIGPTVFRDGVRDYLRTHAYGNADTKDLWIALGKAARRPVPDLMDGWIFQPGYPLVTAELIGESEVRLRQEQFHYLPAASSTTWHVPIQIRIATAGKVETRQLMLEKREQRVTLPSSSSAVLLNQGGHGFYRVRYGHGLLERLRQRGFEQLAPIERFNLVNDSWATTLAGLTPLDEYLDYTEAFRQERDKNVWAVLLSSFSTLNHVVDDSDRSLLQRVVRDRVAPAFEAVGWEPKAGESDLTKQLRSELLGALGRLGNDEATQRQAGVFYERALTDPSSVDPNLMPALVSILAFTGDESRYEQFAERFKTAATPQAERRYLFSLAAFRHKALLERTLAKTLSGDVRVQDAPFVVSAVLHSVYGRELAWDFVKRNWDHMDRLFPKQGLRRMCGGIVGLSTPELEKDVNDFFRSRKIDLGGKTLAQYLEQLRITVTFRERERDRLRSYLGSQRPGARP